MGKKSLHSILNIEYSNIKRNEYSILNMNSKRNKRDYTQREAQQKAMYLADKFHNPSGMRFYLKCAWNLNDNYLDWLANYACGKENPGKYFVSVANKQMLENA